MATAPAAPQLVIGMIADPLSWDRWPEAKALLTPALDESDEDWPGVESDLSTECAQLWAVLNGGTLMAAAITRMVLTKGGEVAEVFLVGGHGFREWIGPLHDVIARSAQEVGCVGMRAYGRAGWMPSLRALGWRQCFVGYEINFARSAGPEVCHR